MKRMILTYGPIVGLAIILAIIAGIELGAAQTWLGYLVMLIAFSTIFFAIRQYRDEAQGGVIRFGTAFLLGLGISAVAGVVYTLVWEIYLAATDFGFIETYAASVIDARLSAGASEAELADAQAEIERFRVQYMNPFVRLPTSFLEVVPAGILVSLVCAGVLRNHG